MDDGCKEGWPWGVSGGARAGLTGDGGAELGQLEAETWVGVEGRGYFVDAVDNCGVVAVAEDEADLF